MHWRIKKNRIVPIQPHAQHTDQNVINRYCKSGQNLSVSVYYQCCL